MYDKLWLWGTSGEARLWWIVRKFVLWVHECCARSAPSGGHVQGRIGSWFRFKNV
jgi:hypothetical protein